jgi:hypothetical protein
VTGSVFLSAPLPATAVPLNDLSGL